MPRVNLDCTGWDTTLRESCDGEGLTSYGFPLYQGLIALRSVAAFHLTLPSLTRINRHEETGYHG